MQIDNLPGLLKPKLDGNLTGHWPEAMTGNGNQPKRERQPVRFSLSKFAHISQFTGEVVAFLVLGIWIDYRWGWTPWATVISGFFGFAVALFHLIRNVMPRE